MSKKLLVLFGKAGSGKDTICKGLCSKFPINKLVRATTRPKREQEQDGIDYFFQDHLTLSSEILNGAENFLEVGVFNDWIYATPKDQLKEGWNITTCDIDAVRQILESDIEVYPVLVYASDKERMLRALHREQSPNVKEIVRRFMSDEEDYKHEDFEYIFLHNPNGKDINWIIQELEKNNIDLRK